VSQKCKVVNRDKERTSLKAPDSNNNTKMSTISLATPNETPANPYKKSN